MASLDDLKKKILEDGVIDAGEVKTLKEEIYADGVVDMDEVKMLASLRNEAKEVCDEFEQFFFEALKKNVLADGKIDAEEVRWLKDVIMADAKVDENEKKFLNQLKSEATSTCPEFDAFLKQATGA